MPTKRQKLRIRWGKIIQFLDAEPKGDLIVVVATNEHGDYDVFTSTQRLQLLIKQVTGAMNLGMHGPNYRLHLRAGNVRSMEVLKKFLEEKGFDVSFEGPAPHWHMQKTPHSSMIPNPA